MFWEMEMVLKKFRFWTLVLMLPSSADHLPPSLTSHFPFTSKIGTMDPSDSPVRNGRSRSPAQGMDLVLFSFLVCFTIWYHMFILLINFSSHLWILGVILYFLQYMMYIKAKMIGLKFFKNGLDNLIGRDHCKLWWFDLCYD